MWHCVRMHTVAYTSTYTQTPVKNKENTHNTSYRNSSRQNNAPRQEQVPCTNYLNSLTLVSQRSWKKCKYTSARAAVTPSGECVYKYLDWCQIHPYSAHTCTGAQDTCHVSACHTHHWPTTTNAHTPAHARLCWRCSNSFAVKNHWHILNLEKLDDSVRSSANKKHRVEPQWPFIWTERPSRVCWLNT